MYMNSKNVRKCCRTKYQPFSFKDLKFPWKLDRILWKLKFSLIVISVWYLQGETDFTSHSMGPIFFFSSNMQIKLHILPFFVIWMSPSESCERNNLIFLKKFFSRLAFIFIFRYPWNLGFLYYWQILSIFARLTNILTLNQGYWTFLI